MKKICVFVFACFLSFSVVSGYAQEPQKGKTDEDLMAIKTEEGLHFRLPKDWPVVKRHGVLMPLPVDEYLSQKMNTVTTQLAEVDGKVQEIMARLEAIEQKLGRIMIQLRQMELQKEAGKGDTKTEEVEE
ncbi:MAG: hypothetical protein ABH845_00530 [Candidatus Omnitrophota bacterium]